MVAVSNERVESNIPRKAKLNRHGSDLEIILEGPGSHALPATIITILLIIGTATFLGGDTDVQPIEKSTELVVNIYDTRPDIRSPASSFFDSYFGLFILLGAAAGLIYYSAGEWLNKIHIQASKEYVEVRHRPLPWLGCKKFSTADIKQLYAAEVFEDEEVGYKSSEVNVVTHDDEHEKFIGFKVNGRGISALHARFVVDEIENYLNGLKEQT